MSSGECLTERASSSSYGQTEADSVAFNLPLSSAESGPDSGCYLSLPTVCVDEDPQFVNPDPKYECLICVQNNNNHRLLRDPVQTTCGHRICQTCVEVYLGTERSKICPAGEHDCEVMTRNNVLPDRVYNREIKQQMVYCFYRSKGCKHKVKLGVLEAHKSQCEFRDVPCTYVSRGCTTTVQFLNLRKHLSICGYRPHNCELCGLEINFNSIKEHDTTICPEATVECPYGCEFQKLKRRQLEEHMTNCPRKPQECKFKSLGCTSQGSKKDIEKHENDFSAHFLLLLEYVTTIKSRIQEQQQEAEKLKSQERNLDNLIKNINKELKLKMVQQVERLITLEQTADDYGQTISSLTQEAVHSRNSIEQLRALNSQTSNNGRQLESHENRLAEMDLRFQMLETASYDGVLLWKISDFSKRKEDATEGRILSLYSQPFYTSKHGYKMCGRVYLNGDGIGRGTHLSLYFAVMRGDYDELLAWPFQCKVTLMLLDQSPQKRHLRDEFVPDRTRLSCYGRPQTVEMNPASGCPLFVSHSDLENPSNHYVKDDCMFIKIEVDTTRLQPV